jgi:conjugative relaxase-like TrwC/TraI family protein
MHGIASARAAFTYFSEKDDYYRADASSAEWHGRGAALAGLSGDVDSRDFRAVLEGRIDDTQVGRADTHAAGWDMTFSAPKSVSVAALVNRDERLVVAHDHAARIALDYIERTTMATRQRGENGRYEFRQTGNMTAAIFRHASSRNHDPQLHSHAVIANATRDPATGNWVSLYSRDLYRAQMEAGAVYTNELARGARAAGYTVDWSVNAKGSPTFELREVPMHVRGTYSTRSSEKVADLRAKGIDPATASAKAKEAAVLGTRNPKEHIPATELHARWKEQANTLDYDARLKPMTSEVSRDTRAAAADEAICAGIAHLSERDSRFTERALLHEARIASQGRADDADLKGALDRTWSRGEMIQRETWQRGAGNTRVLGDGFTTRVGIETERSMLRHAEHIDQHGWGVPRIGEHADQHHSAQSIDARIERHEQATGHVFTGEQRHTVHSILRGESGLHIVQGHAGTAKTTTVLATVAETARNGGWEVRAMAPTGSAAQSLGDAIGAKGETVTAVLNGPPTAGANQRVQAWIVDEAGMVSAKDMNALLAAAEKQQAHVILVGDERQIGSVAAGAAFAQIKAHYPANTHELTEIKRQTSTQLKAAVYDAIRGDMKEALAKVNVTEQRDRAEAIALIADRYQKHVHAGRNTLVVTLSRDDRRDANAAIQTRRIDAGEVRNVQTLRVLDSKQWTPAQQSDAARYQPGDVIQAGRNFKNGPQRGETLTVTQSKDGRVTAQGDRGEWSFDPKRVNAFQVHTARAQTIGEGERIVAKANLFARDVDGASVKLRTGEMLDVRKIDGTHLEVTRTNGQTVALDTRHGLSIDLGYAQTANQAQGKTSDAVIGYMRSSQTNLADQARTYVTLSRAKEHADIVTDNKQRLADTLERNPGIKETAKLNGRESDAAGSLSASLRGVDRRSAFEPPAFRGPAADISRGAELHLESPDRGAGLER